MSDLTAGEMVNVKRALAFLRVRCGGVKMLAKEGASDTYREARDNIPGGIGMYSDIEATYRAVRAYWNAAPPTPWAKE